MKQEEGDGRDEDRDQSGEGGWSRVTVISVAGVALSGSSLGLALGHELGASDEGVSWVVASLGGLFELLRVVDPAVELHASVDVSRAHLREDAWNAVLHEAGGGFSG